MKLFIKIIFLSVFSFAILNAQHYTVSTPAYEHLYEVNKEWKKHKDESPNTKIKFKSDIDRIHFHLQSVQSYLVKNTPKELTKKSLKNRFALLDTLTHYANNKIFPQNTHHTIRQPYFIDTKGTYCAVGYLMAASGSANLAQKVYAEHNYDYIKDIKTKGVTAWAYQNGFTLDELAWIQPGYSPQSVIAPIGDGTNGTVNVLHNSYAGNKLFFAGNFDLVDNLPCLNIGYYEDEQLSCLGTGLSGIIHDMLTNPEEVIVIGELNHNNVNYPMAIFADDEWTFIEIPGRIGASGSTINRLWTSGIEISISHPSIPNQQEIWSTDASWVWERKVTVDGIILDIENGYDTRAYVGHFNAITIHNSNSNDSTISVNNVILKGIFNDNWHSIGTAVSDTIKVVKSIGQAFYFGGSCPTIPNEEESDVCLTRYFNEVLQPLIISTNFLSGQNDSFSINSINTIQLYQDYLVFGGDFKITPFGVGYYGQNLASYDLVHNNISAIALLDKPVNTMIHKNGDLYLGGDFTNNLGSENLPHIAKTNLTVSVININQGKNVQIFPNPVNDVLNIKGLDTRFSYQIFSLSGQLLDKGIATNNKIELEGMLSGAYILHLKTVDGLYTLKFFKG